MSRPKRPDHDNKKKYPVLSGFHEARKRIISSYPTTKAAVDSHDLDHIGQRSSINRLFNLIVADSYFTHRVQKSVIIHFENPELSELNNWISKKTKFHSPDRYSHILGNYRYWRTFPHEISSSIFHLRIGDLRISQKGSALIYQHRSADARSQDWEDDGLAYIFGNRLYCVGFRESNIRLLICHIPDHTDREHFHGLVLSVQKKNQHIFAAAFAMFHESFSGQYEKTVNEENESERFEEFKKFGLADPYITCKIMVD